MGVLGWVVWGFEPLVLVEGKWEPRSKPPVAGAS